MTLVVHALVLINIDSNMQGDEIKKVHLVGIFIQVIATMYGTMNLKKPYHLRVPIVLKSGGLNLLEPSGPVQACFTFYLYCSFQQRS